MDSMIDRVAQGIYYSTRPKKGWDDRSNEYREKYLLQAQSAIEAMREPTDAMLYHMDGYSDLVGPYPEANTKEERLREFRCAYMAAIDAALTA